MTATAKKIAAKTPINGVKQETEKTVEKSTAQKQQVEQPQPSKFELEFAAKRLKRTIDRTKDSLEKEEQKCVEWLREGNRLIKENERKYEADQVKKIIALKEENSIATIDILLNFHESEITRLTDQKKEKEDAGEPGEFSSEYKQYLKPRSARFEKKDVNLKKNWIVWTEDRKAKKIPPLEEKITNLENELLGIDKQIEAASEKVK